MKIAYVVGSLSKESINRALAEAIVELAPEGVEMVEGEIADLPLFNRDNENDFPEPARKFKDLMYEADGVLFITPEHNRSYSAPIHNAIEWASRPYGEWPLAGKPVATAGQSPSGIGAAVGQAQLRQSLLFFGPKLMSRPEAYIDGTKTGVLEDGKITNEDSRAVIKQFIEAFVQFVADNK